MNNCCKLISLELMSGGSRGDTLIYINFGIALCLANCYNWKQFFGLKMHKAFGDRALQLSGPTGEAYSAHPDLLPSWIKGERKGKARQGQKGEKGRIITIPSIFYLFYLTPCEYLQCHVVSFSQLQFVQIGGQRGRPIKLRVMKIYDLNFCSIAFKFLPVFD